MISRVNIDLYKTLLANIDQFAFILETLAYLSVSLSQNSLDNDQN